MGKPIRFIASESQPPTHMPSTTSKVQRCLLFGCCSLLVGTTGCEPAPPATRPGPSHVYDYVASVDEINPMVGVIARLTVKAGDANEWPYRRSRLHPTSAYLFVYSRFQWVRNPYEGGRPDSLWTPRDTLALPLTRAHTDTIYWLTRQVFQLATHPPSRDSTRFPPPPSAHDLDNFLEVNFRYNDSSGPSFTCEGYEECNAASYALRNYLQALQARAFGKRR